MPSALEASCYIGGLAALVCLPACHALDRSHAAPQALPDPIALPSRCHGHRLEAVQGGWLCFGGFRADTETGPRETWWLSPSASAWVDRADMTQGRAFCSSTSYRGCVYAIGSGLARYDPSKGRWQELLPEGALPASHFGAARIGSRIYVLGGATPTHAAMSVVDLDTLAVAEESPPPGWRAGDHFPLVHELGGRLHVIGGVDAEVKPKNDHWILEDGVWCAAATPPPPWMWAKFAALAVVGDVLYAFGDFGAFAFDARAGTWTPRAAMPRILAMPQAVATGGGIWVVGGLDPDAPRARILMRYDLAADAWVEHSPAHLDEPR